MASRLMLSLKKAIQPKDPWSLQIMTTTNQGRPTGDGTINFAPRVPRGLDGILRAPVVPNEEDMELDSVL